MNDRAVRAFSRKQLRAARREAEKKRRKGNLCRCGTEYKVFGSDAEFEAWRQEAKPPVCERCGREKLTVSLTFFERDDAPEVDADKVAKQLFQSFG